MQYKHGRVDPNGDEEVAQVRNNIGEIDLNKCCANQIFN